jgi:hypothetical protein
MVDNIRRNVMGQFAKQGVRQVKENLGIESSSGSGNG